MLPLALPGATSGELAFDRRARLVLVPIIARFGSAGKSLSSPGLSDFHDSESCAKLARLAR